MLVYILTFNSFKSLLTLLSCPQDLSHPVVIPIHSCLLLNLECYNYIHNQVGPCQPDLLLANLATRLNFFSLQLYNSAQHLRFGMGNPDWSGLPIF